MSDAEYTRRYFSEGAVAWLATAYGTAADAVSYPVGARRVRLALEAVVERLGAPGGRLLDLGCGGGDLCLAAAALGFETTGIDVAEGMIAEAEARRQSLPAPARERLAFRVGDALAAGPPGEAADAVTALGLLEYLDDDAPLLRAAARCLRPGGVLVVSCRNRLFNLASLNDYTRREIEAGAALGLLGEVTALRPGPEFARALDDLVARLGEAAPALHAALAADRAAGRETTAPGAPPADFAGRRRQHTPAGLAAAAAAEGFRDGRFVGVHPHPLPPALEAASPRFYNRLAAVFDALDPSPASLAWSSAFLGVFTR